MVDVSRFVCASSCTFATNSDVFHVDVFLIIKFGSMINEQGFPRGSYGKCKGRCLISVLTVGRGNCSRKFPHEVALVKSWHAFRLTGSHNVCGAVLVCSILRANFRKKN